MLNINYFIPEIPFVLRKSYKIYVDEKKNIIFIYNIYFVYVFTDLKTFHRLLTGAYFVWGNDHCMAECLTFCDEGRYFWEIKQTTRS